MRMAELEKGVFRTLATSDSVSHARTACPRRGLSLMGRRERVRKEEWSV